MINAVSARVGGLALEDAKMKCDTRYKDGVIQYKKADGTWWTPRIHPGCYPQKAKPASCPWPKPIEPTGPLRADGSVWL